MLFMRLFSYLFVLLVPTSLFSQAPTRIIDMHAHSYIASDFGEREPPADFYGKKRSENAEPHRRETFAAFKKWKVVKAAVSGAPQSVAEWVDQDTNHLVIKAC